MNNNHFNRPFSMMLIRTIHERQWVLNGLFIKIELLKRTSVFNKIKNIRYKIKLTKAFNEVKNMTDEEYEFKKKELEKNKSIREIINYRENMLKIGDLYE